MSDDNKIIRVTDLVTPADSDFAERIAKAVDDTGAVGERAQIPPPPSGNFLTSAQVLEFAARRESDAPIDYTRKQPLTAKKPWTVNLGTPGSTVIQPGDSITVTEQMQIVFRAKQIVCAPSGGKLYITTVLVGQRIQMMQWSGNGMLMDFLRERTAVDFDTAQPGINIAFSVANRGDTPGTFDLTLFGEAVF